MAQMPKTADPDTRQPTPAARLICGPVSVINVGLEGFAADLAAQKQAVIQVDWAPPAGGNAAMMALLAKLGA